jgi:hypothetical protein
VIGQTPQEIDEPHNSRAIPGGAFDCNQQSSEMTAATLSVSSGFRNMFHNHRCPAALLTLVALFAGTSIVAAQQLSDNWNTSACAFTDTATLEIGQTVHVSKIELWYNWQPNESSVGYTVLFNGQAVGTGSLSRAGCDPYQQAWCVAQDAPDTDLPPGTYTFRTKRAFLCQNRQSGGRGFIRAYGN